MGKEQKKFWDKRNLISKNMEKTFVDMDEEGNGVIGGFVSKKKAGKDAESKTGDILFKIVKTEDGMIAEGQACCTTHDTLRIWGCLKNAQEKIGLAIKQNMEAIMEKEGKEKFGIRKSDKDAK